MNGEPLAPASERQSEFISILEQARLATEIRERAENALVRQNEQMQQELRMAAEFQQAVLPQPADLPFLDTAVLYRPYAEVSGDVYDFLQNREGELAIFLGDATGHGIVAALMTMMIHIGLEGIRRNLPVADSIRKLNGLIAARATGRSVSAVFFRVTPGGRLSVTHAGHPSLIILPGKGGEPVQFEKGGCALSVFDDEPVPYEEEYYQLEAGDRIFAYTDGLVEWSRVDGEIFGLERLLAWLAGRRVLAPDEIPRALLHELTSFSGGRPCRDDLSALVVDYRGP